MSKNITDTLKDLYVAFGGTYADVDYITDIADVITAIVTQVITSGIATNELPTVTATDNGKVLKVVGGKWAVGTDETT